MKTAVEHNGTDNQKTRIRRAIGWIEWIAVPKENEPALSLPMMQGEGLKQAIKEYRIPKVSHVGYSSELAPYGLLAIRGHYKSETVEIYVIDCGSEIMAVCVDVHAKAA